MAKIVINGETFDHEGSRTTMAEALALEEGLGFRYAEWEDELAAGSAKAYAGFVWLIWKRDGRDVKIADILSGEIEINLTELLASLIMISIEKAQEKAAAEAAEKAAAEGQPPDPPGAAVTLRADPAGTATTGTATSASSPRRTASRRPKPTP